MTHRTLSAHPILTVLLVFFLACGAAPAAAGATAAKPNVVLIYIDDLGYGDLGVYGAKDIPTPNIDRLAREGVLCTASYVTNPPCCPSRCSLMMGQYAQRFGKYGMSRGLPVPEDRPTLARFLGDHGYVTGQIGKWDIGTPRQGPLAMGFAEVRRDPPRKQYTPEEPARPAAKARKQKAAAGVRSKYFCLDAAGATVWLTDYDGNSIVDFVGRHTAEPFFLYWSPEAIHSPNTEVPERLEARTTAEGKRRKLAGAIVSVDDQVGKLLDVLHRTGLREKTLVIFTSDNGANPSEGGTSTPYVGGKGQGTQKEGWVRVPTIFSLPGVLPQGRRYDGLMANFDFYSTIAQFATRTIPAHCDGIDLLPYLRGERSGDAHEFLFWLNDQPDDAERRSLIAVRWRDWRLYKKAAQDPWQLFDLRSDPTEDTDLAAQHPDVVRQMGSRHTAWQQTLAPLGEIPDIRSDEPVVPTGHGWALATPRK
jgi:arylsulfatase A-like enzyme